MARDHDAVMIRGLIRRLTGDQRRCLELRWLDGLTLAEVAKELDRTTGAVAAAYASRPPTAEDDRGRRTVELPAPARSGHPGPEHHEYRNACRSRCCRRLPATG